MVMLSFFSWQIVEVNVMSGEANLFYLNLKEVNNVLC